jgi:hypothetical protein
MRKNIALVGVVLVTAVTRTGTQSLNIFDQQKLYRKKERVAALNAPRKANSFQTATNYKARFEKPSRATPETAAISTQLLERGDLFNDDG